MTIGLVGILIGLILGSLGLFFRQAAVNAVYFVTGTNPWDPSIRIFDRASSQDRSGRGGGDPHRDASADLPRNLLPRAQGGEHRSGAGASL